MQTKANSPDSAPSSETAVSLDGFLDPDRVECDVYARSKKHALDLLSEILSNGEQPLQKLKVFDCLVSRERLGSTAIGSAVAIPHARIDQIPGLRAAFIRLAQPVPFDAADGRPVKYLFGLLVPPGDEDIHLRLLSTIARMLAQDLFRKSLEIAPDAEALYEILTEFDPEGNGGDAPDHR